MDNWSMNVDRIWHDSEEKTSARPQVALMQNHPNPFVVSTTIDFTVSPGAAAALPVKLVVCDAHGKRVRKLAEGRLGQGMYSVSWDGRDEQFKRVRAGVYYCRLSAGSDVRVERMILSR